MSVRLMGRGGQGPRRGVRHAEIVGQQALLRGGDVPCDRSEVYFRPLGLPQFAGTQKNQRCQAQGATRDDATLIAVNSTQESPYRFGLSYGGEVVSLDRR